MADPSPPKAAGPAGPGSFTTGPVAWHVVRLSGFMIMGFLAMTLGQLIEAAYLGMVGADELAAIAFTFPVVMALNALTRGIGVGTGAVLARSVGAGDAEQASRLATHGLLLTLIFTSAAAVLLAGEARALFTTLGAKGHVLELTVAYISIWALGFPAFGLTMVGAGLMRSIGDPAFPGWVMTSGALLQILVAPPLIFGWWGITPLGIEGAAAAFVTARAAALAMTLWWFGPHRRVLRASLAGLRSSAADIAHVGVPAAASNLIVPLSTGVITWLLAGFGNQVVAGFGVGSRIEAVVNMVVIGIAASTAPLVGQNWGAGKYARVDETLRVTHLASLAWGVTAASALWLSAPHLAGLISNDAEVTAIATTYLYVVPISIGFTGMANVANAAFNALGRPLPPLTLSVSRLLVVYVPLAMLASAHFGYIGVFFVTSAVNVGFGLLGWWWNRHTVRVMRERP